MPLHGVGIKPGAESAFVVALLGDVEVKRVAYLVRHLPLALRAGPKQRIEVGHRDAPDVIQRHLANRRRRLGDLAKVHQLILFSARLLGGQVRRVGFNQQPVARRGGQRVAQHTRLWKRDVPREGNVKAQSQRRARIAHGAAETVHHTAIRAFFRKDRQAILHRVAAVDNHRLAKLLRQPQMRAQRARLHIARRAVAVIIQPRLADGHHPGMRGQLAEGFHHRVRIVTRLVGMQPHGGVHPLVRFGELDGGAAGFNVVANVKDTGQPRLPRARDHRPAVIGERGIVQVAMGIGQRGHNITLF